MARKFTQNDRREISDYIVSEFEDRKRARKDLEKAWKEIDRQIAMEPDRSHKRLPDGRPDLERRWMAEMELPWQAQSLEVLTADERRMLFPDAGPWFSAHSETSDEYFERTRDLSLIPGDKNDIPSLITQDNADKLTHGLVEFWHRQYDFGQTMDLINAGSTSYGMGIGRARIVTKRVNRHESRGVATQDMKFPALVPRSIKNTYLDSLQASWMNEGEVVSPSVIFCETKRLRDVQEAAEKGSSDPNRLDGGWMAAGLKGLQGDRKNNIEVLEYEGDLVVPRSGSRDLLLPNYIVTVARGKSGKDNLERIIRIRFNKLAGTSYMLFPYHLEGLDLPYGGSPLMKGRVVQLSAVDALNKTMDAAALRVGPPISWDSTNVAVASQRGPTVAPRELWELGGGSIEVHQIGEPEKMFQIFVGLAQMYADVTGVNAPRLGAQTVSHTTAFAKDAELNRGVARTVDYVRTTLKGPLTRWLSMEYEMGLETLGKKQFNIWIDAYRGWVKISRPAMPDKAAFEAFGLGGPQEEQQKTANRLGAVNQALQIDALSIQQGNQPTLNLPKLIDQIMREGGWTDVDAFVNKQVQRQPAQETDTAPAALNALATLARG